MNEREIFMAAIEKADCTERAAYLDQVCGDDAALCRRVQVLLRTHEQAGSFLDAPAPEVDATVDLPGITERPGTVIGPYKLLEQIGEGGMGVVYMADQQAPVKRRVALKIIKPGMDTRQVIARFEAERQALAMMDHVNIARVLDAGATESGRPYFVMELVYGVPITKYCDDNHLAPRERLELFVPVCQAIQHAHQKGIIHRDVKPSNVMITLYDGKPVPKVIDFGVAKATEQRLTERTLFTQYGTMVGTLEYMSPEQAEMSGLGVDTRSDIYSLGVLLYELLTGSTPLRHKRVRDAAYGEVLRMIREEEPPKPSTRLSESGEALASISAQRHMEPAKLTKLVRGELDWIVMKTLDKDRNRRYETANGFAADIERYLNDEPVQACPPSAAYRFRKFARRNRVAFSTAALVLAALVVGTCISTWQAIRAMHAEDLAETRLEAETESRSQAVASQTAAEKAQQDEAAQRAVAEHERDHAVTAEQKAEESRNDEAQQRAIAQDERDRARDAELRARRHLYASQMNLAHQAWEMGHAARALQLLEGQRPKFDQDDLRSFDWYYLWRLCHSRYRFTLSGHKGAVYSVAFAPDGKTLASGSDDRTVRVWDVATGQERGALRGHSSSIRSVAFSPDGVTLASGSLDSTVILWDVDAGRERLTLKGHTDLVLSVAFSPDGETLASGSHDETVKVWDVAKGQERLTLNHPGWIQSVAFSPDGKTLASSSNSGTVKVWDAATGEERFALQGHKYSVRSVAFSPDGKTLASGSDDLTVRLWDVATGQQRSIPKWHGGGVACVAFSPDGKTLASGSDDRTVKLWDLATGQEQVQAHVGPAYSVAFSPDGKTLASGSEDRTVKLWDLDMGSNSEALTKHEDSVRCVAFSPDSKTLATRSEQSVKLWDVATGQERVTLKDHTGYPWLMFPVAFSPDGKTLASTSGDTVKLWNVATAEECRILKHRSLCLAFSPDGRTLASGGGVTVTLWDVATGQEQGNLVMEQSVGSVAFSPDGQTLATGLVSGRVKLWDLATRRERLSLPAGSTSAWIWSVAFSPDGRTLAAGRFDGTVMLWNPDTGQLRASLKGHTAIIRSVTYHPDGKTLATGSDDGTVKVWDGVTGQERVTLRGHTDMVFSVAFSPDGQTLATGILDGTVKLWRAATDKEASALKTELDPDDPDSPVADNNSGDRLGSTGRTGEAEEAYRQAMRRLEKLVVEFPDIPDYAQELAHSHFALGLLLEKSNRLHEAEQAYQQVMQIQEKLAVEFPDKPDYRQELAASHQALADRLRASGQSQEAEQAYLEAVSLLEKMAAEFPVDSVYRSELAHVQHERGGQLARSGRLQEAEQAYRQGIGVREQLAGEFPNVAEYRHELGRSLNWLAILLANDNRLQEAEQAHRHAVELYEKLALAALAPQDGRWHRQELAWTYMNLGNMLKSGQRPEDAKDAFRQAVAVLEKLDIDFTNDGYSGWLANAYNSLALLLSVTGEVEEADKAFRKVLELKPDNPLALNNMAWLLATCPDPKFRDANRAVELAKRGVEQTPTHGYYSNTLGVALYRAGEWNDAIDALKKSDELLKGDLFSFNAFFLAMAHWQLDEKDEARKWYYQAVEWMENNKPHDEELKRFRAEAAELLGPPR